MPAPWDDVLSILVVDADAQSSGPEAYIPTWNLPLRIPVFGDPTEPACSHIPAVFEFAPALYKKNDANDVGVPV
jgi:hypothetical protein